MKLGIAVLFAFLLSLSLWAQSPDEISYQAVIRNSSNTLIVNHPVGMRISILQGSANGTAVYTETQTPTTNTNGLVSIEIGTGTTSNDFSAIDWSGGPYFIKTETDPAGGINYTITGVSQLLSVPYSLYARTAETVTGDSDLNNVITLPNIKIGPGAGMNTPDSISSILAIGDSALFHNSEGSPTFNYQSKYNTAVGSKALFANTTGYSNTAFGFQALQSVTIGPGNNALGDRALNSNTTGSYNIANGALALFSNTSGSLNVGIGYSALYSNTTGYDNVAIGKEALNYDTSGYFNIAIGSSTLKNNTSGTYNTAIGIAALFSNTTAINNTAIGTSALTDNTTGNDNTATGVFALQYNITGAYNIADGNGALYHNNVGEYNSANGYHALYNNTSGSYNDAVGYDALINNTTGTGNVAIGYNAGPSVTDLSNSGAYGYGASVTASNTVQIGNSSVTQIGGYVAWSNLSDGRFKTNVKANVPGLDFIMKLRPVTFSWNMDKLDAFKGVNLSSYTPEMLKARKEKETKVYTGFIAQEVEKAADSCNYDFSGVIKPANDKTPYNLSYAEFVVPLVKAMQEQEQTIKALQSTIADLKSRVDSLEKK